MNFDLIKYYYEVGSYSLEDVAAYVEMKILTEDDFHDITGYSY